MSFKTAPRYLSGVSVFLGDDITKRDTDGELVFFIGQSVKGPNTAIDLKSIDNLVPIYGNDSPLVKAAYEFWDGFIDSKQQATLRPIALRVGGKPAVLSTSFGVTITTADAYNGIEDDYFVFIDDTADVDGSNSRNIKIWDKNKALVYNQVTGVDSEALIVEGELTGATNKMYGDDLSANPQAAGTTIKQMRLLDQVSFGSITVAAIEPGDTSITVVGDIQQVPSEGTLALTSGATTIYTNYSIPSYAGQVINITPIAEEMDTVTVKVVGATLTPGDSELNLTDRELYEKFRNALLDVETFTPDYLVPGGVTFDAKGSYLKTTTLATTLSANLTSANKYAYVAGAAQWPTTGVIDIPSVNDELAYVSKAAQTLAGTTVYALEIEKPVFKLGALAASGASSIAVVVSGTDTLDKLQSKGYVQLGADAADKYRYTAVAISGNTATLTLADALTEEFASDTAVAKLAGAPLQGATVSITFTSNAQFDLGIGYVKETDEGDKFTFEWSDEKYVPVYDSEDNLIGHETYNLAHFGYLLANFCQEASVGYNTPLCGMNTSVPANPYDRTSIVNWIGSFPTFKVRATGTDAIEAVTSTGTGLLGDAVLVGSQNYNRCYMSNPLDNKFVDPAYGLLLTEEGFIDGTEVKDSYGKVVDLGKFLCVGAGLLTFTNRAKNMSYVDTMGIYALGMLAGTPKNEGISFAKIGSRSNVAITSIVSRKLYNDLVNAGYIVPTREKGLGWVINNDNSAVRKDSGYFLISTTRTIKDVIERKRSILVNFIGKPMNRFYLEAAKTKIAESFGQDIQNGFLNGFNFTLDQVVASSAIGKLLLKVALNPALELVQVDIDAVIDRNVTNQG